MEENIISALTNFSGSVSQTFSPVDALKVIGIVFSSSALLFFAIWGAKLLINFISYILEQRRQHKLFYKLFYTKEITTEEFLDQIDKK